MVPVQCLDLKPKALKMQHITSAIGWAIKIDISARSAERFGEACWSEAQFVLIGQKRRFLVQSVELRSRDPIDIHPCMYNIENLPIK